MKATRFIAVGALALTSAAFADGIASDIVGYKQQGLRAGSMLYAPCFVDVGGEGVDLTKLTPGGEYASGQIVVSVLDNVGRNIEDYRYVKDRSGNWYWKDDNGAVAEGKVVFAQGQGVSVEGDDGLSITGAGAVSTDDIVINLRSGSTMSGNCTAVNLDLVKIVPGGEYASGQIVISKLDNVGRNIADYRFVKDRGGNWYWKGDDGAIAEGDVVFEPGEGFSVEGDDGLTITIPGPTL